MEFSESVKSLKNICERVLNKILGLLPLTY